jgi:uncharacterized coiled-coil protein SlyX
MAQNIVVNLEVDTAGAVTNIDAVEQAITETSDATKSLKAQLRALQVEMQDIDPSDAKFDELSKQAGELKDRINDASEAIRNNAGNAFEGLSNNAQTLGGRLLAMDFSGVGASAKAMAGNVKNINFKLVTEEVGGMIKGFAQLGKALLANPIFFIGAAVVGIIANFEELKKLISLTYSEETKAVEAANANVTAQQEKLDAISSQENVLKLQGKSEREILMMKIEQTKQVIAAMENTIRLQKAELEAQIAAEERAKSILKGIINFITMPLRMLAIQIDAIGEGLKKIGVVSESFGLEKMLDKGVDMVADMVFSPDDVRKKGEETNKALQKQLDDAKNQLAGNELALKAMDKKSSDDRKAAREKDAADKKAADEKALKDREAAIKKEIEMERWADSEITRMEREMMDAQKLRDQEEIAAMQEVQRIADEMDAESAAKKKKDGENEKMASEARVQLAADGFAALASLTESFAGKGKKAQEKAFKVNKAFQIAQALIQTYQSASAAYASQMAITTPDAPIRAAVAAGIVVASGLAQVAKIRATKFDGGGSPSPSTGGGGGGGGGGLGGGGGSQGGTPTFNPIDTSFLGNRPAQSTQAYVLAGHVSSAQDANAKVKDLRRL